MGSLKPFVLDGYNIAMEHGRSERNFSCKGIFVAVSRIFTRFPDHFVVLVFPSGSKPGGNSVNVTDDYLLEDLRRKFAPDRFQVVYAPLKYSLEESGRWKIVKPFDNRVVVEVAHLIGGWIVSKDSYDSSKDYPEWADVLGSRMLSYSWCRDTFHLVVDPVGRAGPEDLFLSVGPSADPTPQNIFATPQILSVGAYMALCLRHGHSSYLEAEQQKIFDVTANAGLCAYETVVRVSPNFSFGVPIGPSIQDSLVISSTDSGVSVGVNRSMSNPLSDDSSPPVGLVDGVGQDLSDLTLEQNDNNTTITEGGESSLPPTPVQMANVIQPRENFNDSDEEELITLIWSAERQKIFADLSYLFVEDSARIEAFMTANPQVDDILEIIEKAVCTR